MRSVVAGAGRVGSASGAAGAVSGTAASAPGSASGAVTTSGSIRVAAGTGLVTTGAAGGVALGIRATCAADSAERGGVRSTIGAGRVAGPLCAQDNAASATNSASAQRAAGRTMGRRMESRRRGHMERGKMADEGDVPEATAKGAGAPVFRAMPGSLYVVATPLGNAAGFDAARARRPAQRRRRRRRGHARLGAAARAHGIAAHLLSLHAHNEARRSDAIVASLAAGKSVALVSDAGTPAISDPGARLVRAVREAGYPVVPIPGPSAVTAALCAAGLDAERVRIPGLSAGAGQGAPRVARRRWPRCRWRSSCTRRRIACAQPSPSWRWRCPAAARWSSRASSPRCSRRSRACRSPMPPHGSTPSPTGSAANSC